MGFLFHCTLPFGGTSYSALVSGSPRVGSVFPFFLRLGIFGYSSSWLSRTIQLLEYQILWDGNHNDPALSCGLHCGFSPPVSFLGVSIYFLKCLTSKVSFYDVVMSRICRRARHRLCHSGTVPQVESLWKQYKSFHPMHRLRCDGRQCTEI